jgi:hypothetical protein
MYIYKQLVHEMDKISGSSTALAMQGVLPPMPICTIFPNHEGILTIPTS